MLYMYVMYVCILVYRERLVGSVAENAVLYYI